MKLLGLSWILVLVRAVYVGANDDDLLSDTAEKAADHIPIILTKPDNIYVVIGGKVKLECKTEKLDPYSLIWKKGNDMLTVGENKMTTDERIQLEATDLIITNLTEKDIGEYTCVIDTNKQDVSIKHNLMTKSSQRDDASKTPVTTEMEEKEMKSGLTNESDGNANGAGQPQLDQRAKMVAVMTVVILVAFF